MAVIFPFERPFYEQHGYERAVYVGHPFASEFTRHLLSQDQKAQFMKKLGIDPSQKMVAILPGSREREIRDHLTPMLQGMTILKQKHPEICGIIPVAPGIDRKLIDPFVKDLSFVTVTDADALHVMQCAEAGLLKSGTSNLQAAFCGLPFLMFYLTTPFSALLVKKFVRLTEYSMVNIMRPGTIRELIQERCTPENIAGELERLIYDQNARTKMKRELGEVAQALSSCDPDPAFAGCQNSYERVAKLVLELAGEQDRSSTRSAA